MQIKILHFRFPKKISPPQQWWRLRHWENLNFISLGISQKWKFSCRIRLSIFAILCAQWEISIKEIYYMWDTCKIWSTPRKDASSEEPSFCLTQVHPRCFRRRQEMFWWLSVLSFYSLLKCHSFSTYTATPESKNTGNSCWTQCSAGRFLRYLVWTVLDLPDWPLNTTRKKSEE